MSAQDLIAIRIERDNPIALEQLTFGMASFGAEYERFLRKKHPKAADSETDLLVQRVTEKCIWIELIGSIAPVLQGMDNILIFKEFISHISTRLGALQIPSGRIEDTTPRELENLSNMAEMIANDPNGELEALAIEYKSKTEERKVAASIKIKTKDSRIITDNARSQIKEITGTSSSVYRSVLMRLYQTNIANPSPDRTSGEKGIIEAIGDAPRRLIYASDLAGQRIKSAWQEESQNPYDLGFVVDVDVQMANGKPRAYRITDVYDIFDLTEDQ